MKRVIFKICHRINLNLLSMRHFTLLTYLTLLAFPLCVQNASAQQEVKLKPRVIFTSSRAVPEPGKAEVAARTGQFEMSPNERAVFFSDRASWRKKVSSKTGGSTEAWQHFSFQLPEDAKYVAIRNKHTEFAVLLDNLQYTLNISPVLQGYKVYCDGKDIATLPATDQSFTHNNTPILKYRVTVTAPQELAVTNIDQHSAVVSWKKNPTALSSVVSVWDGSRLVWTDEDVERQ